MRLLIAQSMLSRSRIHE